MMARTHEVQQRLGGWPPSMDLPSPKYFSVWSSCLYDDKTITLEGRIALRLEVVNDEDNDLWGQRRGDYATEVQTVVQTATQRLG
jgi:hypothetical protein